MEKRTKAELLAWIEQHQPLTREKLLGAFEDMDYEQLQGWLSELQRKRKLLEVNPETYYTTIEPPRYHQRRPNHAPQSPDRRNPWAGCAASPKLNEVANGDVEESHGRCFVPANSVSVRTLAAMCGFAKYNNDRSKWPT